MADFHFIRPMWFFALIPLIWMLWQLNRQKLGHHGWQQIIPAHLVKHLMQGQNATRHQPFWLLAAIWLFIVIALAGPVWEKLPQPVYQTNTGKVLIMDMSLSMGATDLTPNRLTKARFKAIDLIDKIDDADMGLIAYSGDAFVISPLTADSKNLVALIPSLSPQIMPLAGSNAYAAIDLADQLLKNAGYTRGEIYWITDGIESNEFKELQQRLSASNHRVSILGVGTTEGAPIKQPNGELLKDNRGSIVIPKLNDSHLRALAHSTGGAYSRITSTSIDINTLAEQEVISREAKKDDEQLHQGDQYKEFGPIIVILILPFAAYAFRRGLVFALVLMTSGLMLTLPAPVKAANDDTPPSWWTNLWQTKDQQAAKQFEQQNYSDAAQLFENNQWRGSSLYKSGDYEGALKAFQQSNDATSLYNQGNAHAQMQNYPEALKAYEQALKQQPDMTDAKKNHEIVKKLLEQQQNQQDQNQEGENQEGENQDQQDKQQQNQQDQNEQGEQGDQNDQTGQGEQEQPNPRPNEKQDEQQSEQQDKQQQSQQSEQKGDQDPQAKQQQEQQQSVPGEQKQPQEGEQSEEQQLKPSDQQSTEEQEQMQEIQQLIRKINDDPAVLLRNKMQLEYQKRKHQNALPPGAKSW